MENQISLKYFFKLKRLIPQDGMFPTEGTFHGKTSFWH